MEDGILAGSLREWKLEEYSGEITAMLTGFCIFV